MLKHVRCNPDVAPRLTSGGYEEKVDVITPTSIGGGECWPLVKIKLMLLPQSTYCSGGRDEFQCDDDHDVMMWWCDGDDDDDDDDDHDHDDGKCGATSGLGRTC